jgi:hypothetical protein
MQAALRIITELPLRDLWDDAGPVLGEWVRDLSATDIRELLRQGSVRFVVADIGAKPQWISETRCYSFWKTEVLPHLAEPNSRVKLGELPNQYGYFASEWRTQATPVIVLQCCH